MEGHCGIGQSTRLEFTQLYGIAFLCTWLTGCGFVDSGVDANIPPNQYDDIFEAAEGGNLNVPAPGILQNDLDGGNRPLTARLRTGPSHAISFQLNADGSFTYTHDGGEGTEDKFTYFANDGIEDSAPATVTINLTPVNDPPVANDDNHTYDEDAGTVGGDVRANDTDPDNPSTDLTLIEVAGSTTSPVTGTWGTLSWNADGTYQYAMNPGVQSLKPTEFVQDTFAYTIQDQEPLTSSAMLTITVTGRNDAPSAQSDSGYEVLEGGTLMVTAAGGVLANDSDVENDAIITVLATNPGHAASFALSANGGFSYQHNGGETMSDSFTYQAMDTSQARSEPATVTITILPVNDAPNAVNDSGAASAASILVPVTGDLRANDSDPDDARATLSVTQVDGTSISPQTGAWVTLSWQADGSYSAELRPNVKSLKPNEQGVDVFTYTLNDPHGASDTATLTITIFGVNDPPIATDDNASTNEDTPVTVNVLANDTDPENDALTIIGISQGASGTVVNNGADVTYTPNLNFSGTDSFTYTVTDSISGSDTATVAVTVNPVNDPPVAADDSASTILATPITISVLSNDTDPDAGDTLAVDTVTQGTNGTVTNNGGNVTYTPNIGYLGTDNFTYRVKDGSNALSNFATVTVTVTLLRGAPRTTADQGSVAEDATAVSSLSAQNLSARSATIPTDTGQISGNTLANDEDDKDTPDELTMTAVNASPVSPVRGKYGVLSWSPNGDYRYTVDDADPDTDALAGGAVGHDGFDYTVRDSDGNETVGTLTIAVHGANDPPRATGSCATTPQERIVSGRLTAFDVDTAVSALTFRATPGGEPSKGTLTIEPDGRYSYVPHPAGTRGRDQFGFEVDDGSGGVASGIATVIIHPRIMPLGDSLTLGTVDGTANPADSGHIEGYRRPLWNALRADGYVVDLVGTRQNGDRTDGFDADHEGHPGAGVTDLASQLPTWLDSNPPDIVLLQIGSDEIAADGAPGAPEVEDLLNQIDTWTKSPGGNDTMVLMGLITNQTPYDDRISIFNSAATSVSATRSTDEVALIDLEQVLTYPDDLYDGVHPSAEGYARIAEAWRKALERLLDKCP